MKTDLTTAIVAAIFGFIVAFFVSRLLIPPIEAVKINTLTTNTDNTVAEPNQEVFNDRAINPTVEVYVGQCKEYDTNGNCIDEVEQSDINEDYINPSNPDNSNNSNNSSNTDNSNTDNTNNADNSSTNNSEGANTNDNNNSGQGE